MQMYSVMYILTRTPSVEFIHPYTYAAIHLNIYPYTYVYNLHINIFTYTSIYDCTCGLILCTQKNQ